MFPATIRQPWMPWGRPPRPSSTSSGHAVTSTLSSTDRPRRRALRGERGPACRGRAPRRSRAAVAEPRRPRVLEGRWTFEIVERFDDDYYDVARSEVAHLEQACVGGRRHAHEEALRTRRRAQRAAFLAAETRGS